MTHLKTMAIVLGVLISVLANAHGQSSFTLSAKRVGTYSSHKKIDCPNHLAMVRSVAAQISVRNLANTNATIKVEWYFIAQRMDTHKRVLFGAGEKSVTLMKGASTNFVERSDNIIEHSRSCVELNVKTDAKIVGYLVRGTAEDGTVRFVVAQPSLKDVLESPAEFEALKTDSKEWQGARPKISL